MTENPFSFDNDSEGGYDLSRRSSVSMSPPRAPQAQQGYRSDASHELSESVLDAYADDSEDLYHQETYTVDPFHSKDVELRDLSQEQAYYTHDYEDSRASQVYSLSPERNHNVLQPPEQEYYQYSPDSSNMYLNSHPQQQFAYDEQMYANNHQSMILTDGFERDEDEPEFDEPVSIEEDDYIDDEQVNALGAGDSKVKLLNDQYYSFDYPVPSSLVNKLPFEKAKEMTEFTHMRYHAITADPKDYRANEQSAQNYYIDHYPFRQTLYKYPRETELLIVCTMYNEDEVLLARTLKGIFKNIKYMVNKKSGSTWGPNSWKKIVVLIVSDGKTKINPRSKALLTLLGVFQEDIMQEKVNDEDVNAHLFEYTTTLGIGKFKTDLKGNTQVPIGADNKTVPVQLMFLLKEQNKQKINSHRWALNFIAPNLRPEVVVLLDVGTEPGPNSIYKLWQAFKDPKVGGACGEIRAMLGNHASMNDEGSFFKKVGRKIGFLFWDFTTCLLNPLVAAQNFEYKISNILDKPMESAFGFVTVLPGAFSAYRYSALQGDPLAAYFHGEDMKTNFEKPAGVLESNMYLAEDRILCFELVVKKSKSYLLRYIHDSYAVTDVPSQIPEFINQRRRWLNGSFFAAVYAILHFYRLLTSSHNIFRKMFLVVEIIYQTISVIMAWFNLSLYFLVFRILCINIIGVINEKAGNILAVVFLWVYICALGLSFVLSFGNKPSEAKWLYTITFVLFSSIFVYMSYCVVMLTINSFKSVESEVGNNINLDTAVEYLKNAKFRNLTISLASTYVLYILGSLIFFDFFHLFACTLQYLLLSPAYVNVLAVFAFCNIHDISWGTKGALSSVNPAKTATVKNNATGANELLLAEKLVDPEVMYNEAISVLKNPEEESDGAKDNVKISEKNYALGRTYTVILWLITNMALIVVILRTGGLEDFSNYEINKGHLQGSTGQNVKRNYWTNDTVGDVFMTVILWSVAGMALFRFIGCVYYRISFFFNRRVHSRDKVGASRV